MKKRFFVALMVVACLTLGGCGDSNTSVDNMDAEVHESEDVLEAEDITTEDSEVDMSEEETDGGDEESNAEVKGIVAMVSRATIHSNTIQIISIDPDTGIQEIISEFLIKSNSDEAYQRADNRVVTRNWFSNDYTKMAISKRFLNASQSYLNEDHAGWIDTNGDFFDMTEASGLRPEDTFSNTDVLRHKTLGFFDDDFVFLDTATEKVYYMPFDNVSEMGAAELSEENDYIYMYLLKHPVNVRPTCQIDEHTYIVDLGIDQTSRPSPLSVIYDFDTDEERSYIPESSRWNWSGVMSPDGDMVAFFSSLKDGMGKVELYKVPSSGGEPTKITLKANDDVIVDLTALPAPSYEHPSGGVDDFLKLHDAQYCRLLEWR